MNTARNPTTCLASMVRASCVWLLAALAGCAGLVDKPVRATLYDFGPGPYVQGLTVVEAGAEGAPFTFARQLFAEGPRVPIMRSTLTRIGGAMEVTTPRGGADQSRA